MAKNIEDYDEIIRTTENETIKKYAQAGKDFCLLYTSPSPRDVEESRMPSSA